MAINRAARTVPVLALVFATSARAQSLSGVLRDSLLYDGPLPNAVVWIDGSHRRAIRTDAG